MELLNIEFALLLIKLCISVLPGLLGIFLAISPENKKRDFRNVFCSKVFGVSNAFPYRDFARALNIISSLMIGFSLVASWILIFRGMF